MKRPIVALLVLAVFAAGLVPAIAAAPAKQAVKKPAVQKKTVSAVCPVMGSRIPDVSKAPGGKMVYKGKTYYFCCPACKPLFKKNPEKYIKQMHEREAAAKKQAKPQPKK